MAPPTNVASTGYGPRIPFKHFDGSPDNYEDWEDAFISSLRLLDLHLGLPQYLSERPAVGFDLAKCQRNIYDYLTNVLDKTSHGIIRRGAKEDGATALKLLRSHYVRETDSRVQVLWRQLVNNKMGEKDVTEYLNGTEETISNLRAVKEKVSDSLAVVCTLDGLTPKFSNFVEVANQRSPQYSYNQLKIALLSCEDRLKQESDEVMLVKPMERKFKKFKPKNLWCEYCEKTTNHITRDCFEMKRVRNKTNESETQVLKCEYCQKVTDHITRDCVEMKRVKTRSAEMEDGVEYDFNMHVSHELKCDKVAKVEVGEFDNLILVDSGCTTHIERNEANFTNFNQSFNPEEHSIKLADGNCKTDIVKGTGTVFNQFNDTEGKSFNVKLNDALLIPNFSQDIMSVYKSVKSGCTITFAPEGSFLKTKSGNIFDIVEKNKLYYLQRKKPTNKKSPQPVEVLSTSLLTPGKFSLAEWHRILGHCNIRDIKLLPDIVDNMKITDFENFQCTTCIQAKMTQQRNRKVNHRVTKPLQLVYCDVVGPIAPASREGHRYSITFIDEFSGAMKIYMLKLKNGATLALRKFLADTAPHGTVKRLRCDGGGEFIAGSFREVCLDHKIKLEFTSPYSPHQNGKCERSHRTVFETTRALLFDSKLPKNLWPYAARMAVEVRNRCFNHRTRLTPIEVLTGTRPNFEKLHLFGSSCYAYKQNPAKLEARGVYGKFIGYDPDGAAKLVYFPENQTIRKFENIQIIQDSCSRPEFPHLQVLGPAQLPPAVVKQELPKVEIEAPSPSPVGELQTRPNDTPLAAAPAQTLVPEPVATPTTEPATTPEVNERPIRIRKKPEYLNDFVTTATHQSFIHHCYKASDLTLPSSYQEATSSPAADSWRAAMEDELQSLKDAGTYELAPLPEGRTAVGSRWIFAMKPLPNGGDKF